MPNVPISQEEEEQRRRAEAEVLKKEETAQAEKNIAEELVRKQSELKAFLEVERAKLQQERQALSVQVLDSSPRGTTFSVCLFSVFFLNFSYIFARESFFPTVCMG